MPDLPPYPSCGLHGLQVRCPLVSWPGTRNEVQKTDFVLDVLQGVTSMKEIACLLAVHHDGCLVTHPFAASP